MKLLNIYAYKANINQIKMIMIATIQLMWPNFEKRTRSPKFLRFKVCIRFKSPILGVRTNLTCTFITIYILHVT